MPRIGIIASTVLATIAMVVSYMGSAGYTVFNTLVYMSGITAAIPYAFSALAQIKWRIADNRPVHTPRLARDVIVAVGTATHRPGAPSDRSAASPRASRRQNP